LSREQQTWPLYASGGFGNRIWQLTFTVGAASPIAPAHALNDGALNAPSIDLSRMAPRSAIAGYNGGREPLYPTGLALSRDGRELYVANNLGDSLGVVQQESDEHVQAIDLRDPAHPQRFLYPYDVRVVSRPRQHDKVYVSCWNDSTVAVVDARRHRVIGRIAVGPHPNAMIATADNRYLLVASANSDTVSVIDTASDREVERIAVGLTDEQRLGHSPQALALSGDERTLFVANAQTQSVAVVAIGGVMLSRTSTDGDQREREGEGEEEDEDEDGSRSRVLGYIPTARYPSALAVVGPDLFIGNGKGEPAARPNAPTQEFPPTSALRGAYVPALMRSSARRVALPKPLELTELTSRVLEANGLVGPRVDRLFSGPSPITHVIYIIKENRTYDQVFGDLPTSGDGTPADGDASLAIFGNGEAARRGKGPLQKITPNHRALALRFGLFDRFFVNSEASPDGHNWSTAAFSTDYVDKTFRWNYSGRGRSYDYEGFNRAPSIDGKELPPGLRLPVTADDLATFMKRDAAISRRR
jgi:YVTN family beta-propeller protein